MERIVRAGRVIQRVERRYVAGYNQYTKKSMVPIEGDEAALEAARTRQAPNRVGTWSKSQRPREEAMTGPRFEQTDLTKQPAPWAAIDLIAEQPIVHVSARKAVCDGGGGARGHPKIFINVDKPEGGKCGYCGLRFQMKH